ncbi:MAG TPA: Mur ligase family protein [Thermoguttaceae bacterium]|nr:Mur ligase family protein [Thermoguttaceae bacterium]
MNYRGKRITVMGLGHFGGGAAAARWLARQNALVTVTDRASEIALAEPLASLDGAPIHTFHLGAHHEDDFRRADLVVVNPAVRPGDPFLEIARRHGVPLTTEIGLLLQAITAPVVGVTGSNGKSTTTAMIAEILKCDGRRTWLGGNLGGSLLDDAHRITADDGVVLELSSFQLHHLPPDTVMPRVAVVTNCTPNHLDWHADWPAYVAAKQRLLARQPADGRVVLGHRLDETWSRVAGPRRVPLFDDARIGPLRVPGKHNRENAVCAAAAAMAAGCGEHSINVALQSFAGLPGRFERIATVAGRDFYNDTTATTPESTIAALGSLVQPMWLLVGGGSKGIDPGPLLDAIAATACGAAFYGQLGPLLHDSLMRRPHHPTCVCRESLVDVLTWCFQQSRPGHAIVLSPAFTSHDQFRNFEHRGATFVSLVKSLS